MSVSGAPFSQAAVPHSTLTLSASLGRTTQFVVGRLLRFWDSRNIKKILWIYGDHAPLPRWKVNEIFLLSPLIYCFCHIIDCLTLSSYVSSVWICRIPWSADSSRMVLPITTVPLCLLVRLRKSIGLKIHPIIGLAR